MYMIKKTAFLGAFLVILLASSPTLSQQQFGLDSQAIRKALIEGQIYEALEYYESQAEEAEKRLLDHDSYQRSLRKAFRIYRAASKAARYAGDLQKAIDYGFQALAIAERMGRPDLQINAILRITVAQRLAGDYNSANGLIAKGFELLERLPERGNRTLTYEADLYQRLGTNLLYAKQVHKALPALQRALSLREAILTRLRGSANGRRKAVEQNSAIVTAIYLGGTYYRLGKPKLALEQYDRALDWIKEWDIVTHHDVKIFWRKGEIHFSQKEYPQALENFQNALTLFQKRKRLANIANTNRRIATVYMETGKVHKAILFYQEAIKGIESTRSLLEAGYRQTYFQNKLNAYTGIVQALLRTEKIKEAFHYAERARARLFLDMLASKVDLGTRDKDLQQESKMLSSRVGTLRTILANKMDPEGLTKELSDLEKSYDDLVIKTKEKDPESASLLTVQPLTLQEVQNLLDRETTLIEYFVTEDRLFVWVIGKDRMQFHQVELTGDKLNQMVRAFRQSIAQLDARKTIHRLSSDLYENLIQPFASDIKGKHLIIVPHDALHYLPFQALLSPSGKYLIENYSISYLPSSSLLKYLPGKRKESMASRVLALANPALDNSTKPKLQFAEDEAKEIRSLYSGTMVLTNEKATEEASKTLSSAYDILHFAAHTELNEEDPLESAILLTKNGKDDGRLKVREVFDMSLKADLVVLSACETGLGKLLRGDELIGLTRAFIYAGTPSVIASLWKVEDRSTAAIMKIFYKNLKTMPKAEALRQAQLEFLRKGTDDKLFAIRGVGGITTIDSPTTDNPWASAPSLNTLTHPYFWAPFILVGDGD